MQRRIGYEIREIQQMIHQKMEQFRHEDGYGLTLVPVSYTHLSGVLAAAGEDDYPYAVPLSYVYCDFKLYFHCAKEGHKLEAIARNPKVSFCVIDQDQVVPEKYTTYFRSVIVFRCV